MGHYTAFQNIFLKNTDLGKCSGYRVELKKHMLYYSNFIKILLIDKSIFNYFLLVNKSHTYSL